MSSDFETDQQIPLLALLIILPPMLLNQLPIMVKFILKMYREISHTRFSLLKIPAKEFREEDIPIIFEPGYTTKYNDQGVAATGIGLSHVQEIIQHVKRGNSS